MAFAEQGINQFAEALADHAPTPGGGAASAIIAALATSLGQMVVRFSINKPRFAEHKQALTDAIERLEAHRAELMSLADRDADTFETLNAAFKLDKADPSRPARIAEAARGAIEVPLRSIRIAAEVAELLASLRDRTNKHLASDLAIASIYAEATARAARMLVYANADLLADDRARDSARALAQTDIRRAVAALATLPVSEHAPLSS